MEVEASLVYRASSRTARATHKNPVFKRRRRRKNLEVETEAKTMEKHYLLACS